MLEQIVTDQHRRPQCLRRDNGLEMTSNALRDWCRFGQTGTAFIEHGSQWEHPFVELFNSRVHEELLAVESFSCVAEAKVMIGDFRIYYICNRPDRAHQMMTPAAFADGYRSALQVATASTELHDRYAIAPSHAGADLTLKEPTNYQLSQRVDR